MLEILLMRGYLKKIGAMLREKNRGPLGFQILAALLWFGGEITGIVIGLSHDMGNGALALGLMGAATGAGAGYLIAASAKGVATADEVGRVFD